jgi:hypothetical protein
MNFKTVFFKLIIHIFVFPFIFSCTNQKLKTGKKPVKTRNIRARKKNKPGRKNKKKYKKRKRKIRVKKRIIKKKKLYIIKDPGLKIVKAGKKLAFKNKIIVVGSCWDFVNKVFKSAGYPSKKRKTIFRSRKKGPYASVKMIKPGDWLYHINMEFNGVEHSAIFIKWMNKAKKIAKMLAYAGMRRREPGRYKIHNLSKVYNIIRAVDKKISKKSKKWKKKKKWNKRKKKKKWKKKKKYKKQKK